MGNIASHQGFDEWWNRDYIQGFLFNHLQDKKVKWFCEIAFEAGISLALSTLQEGIAPLTCSESTASEIIPERRVI